MTYPGGEVAKYTYYNDGLMQTMTFTSSSGGTGYTWEYKYDSYGRLSNIKRPDGTKEERIYDEAGKLESQIDKDSKGEIVQQNEYTYNIFGEIITKSTTQTGNIDKLQSVKMTYNAANRLETYGEKQEAVQYDPKGNMTYGPVNGKMSTLTYDSRNRLTSAGGVTYSYDAENNRISSTENGLVTEYVTDSSGSLSRLLVAYEPDNTQTLYIYGAEGLAGQYNTGTGERLYYHFDNIGSTTCMTDQTGAVVESFAYGTYGELLTQVKKNIRFLYNGSYGVMTDSNGLYYMRARYYNPDIKRFINQDIKVGDISNSQSLNRYAYCEGNPISLVDPFGLSPQTSQNQGTTSKYQWLHNALDVAGLFFDGADAINAVLYAAEGDWKNAALCAVSVVPLVGSAVVGVVKGAKAVVKAKKAAKITELAQESMKLTKNAGNALDTLHDTMSVSTKWGDEAWNISTGMKAQKGAELMKTIEVGSEFGQEANKAVMSMKAAVGADGVRLTTTTRQSVDVFKSGSVGSGGVGVGFKGGKKDTLALPSPQGTNPWMEGTEIISMPAPKDCYINMAMAPGQNKPGGWGTFDNIPNVDYVRNELAVTPEFKPEVSDVQRFLIPEGTQIQIGIVGPQKYNNTIYYGGGNQVQILNFEDRATLIPIGPKKKIY